MIRILYNNNNIINKLRKKLRKFNQKTKKLMHKSLDPRDDVNRL